MRSNLPVTQRGYPLRAGKTLVSVTDLKGRIVYCNEAFIDVSGYTRDELLGQAHNIVRHPDMPEEAFRDMWATIEGGRPWSALVKNRRKNGDHYWVHANATPIRDGDRPAGYLSVRSAPQPEQVAQAEALYAEMRREAESGKLRTRLHHGQVVRGGLVGRLAQGLSAAATHIGLSGLMGLFASVGTGVAAMFTGPAVWVPVAMGLFAAAHLMGRRADRQGLQRVLDDMLRLAAGDLTHDVKVTQAGTLGELQLATAQLAANLRTVIGDIRTEVENVRGAVAEISAGNLDLSSRTEAQAASLEQTAASMEEINGTVRQSAASATQGATLAAQTMSVAERSHDSVLGVVQAMEDINKSAAQVGAIIHVIESVAFQTNILALNAAVEAARAGEAGRGFAVVASEVRTLAHRTSESARQIKQLIGESTEHAAAGARLTQEARDRMGEALQSVSRVNEVPGEISIAATEQQTGVAQVNEAVTHMDAVTQQNAAMVEEMSAATNALNGQIQQIVDVMKLIRLRPGEATAADVDAAGLRREAKAARDGGDAGEFDLEAAVDRHLQWKTKLRNAVMRGEALDADAASRDDGCPLGQWLHGKGRHACGHLPGFAPLLDQHAVFHREAGRVARLVNAGRKDEVNHALAGGTPFAESTQATVMAIRQLKHECAGGHTPHITSRTTRAPVATAKSVTTTSRASTADTAEGDWATF